MMLQPTDLPRLRGDLVDFIRTQTAVELRQTDMDEGLMPAGDAAASVAADRDALQHAELFYVTPDMAELIVVAAASLPRFTLAPEDVPTPHGVVYFVDPVVDVEVSGKPVHVAAIVWTTVGGGLQVTTCLRRDHAFLPAEQDLMRLSFPPIMPFGSCLIPVSTDGTESGFSTAEPGGTMMASLKTLWLLMRQPVTDVTTAPLDRATRRRYQREHGKPPTVRVIALRRSGGGPGDGQSDRQWRHRWMVRGHWRMQPYGAGRELVRPVWIAPYVKGPEGAPLLGGEKVYLVRGDPEPPVDSDD